MMRLMIVSVVVFGSAILITQLKRRRNSRNVSTELGESSNLDNNYFLNTYLGDNGCDSVGCSDSVG